MQVGEVRHENVRGGGEIVLRMAAHQLPILGEGHVALEDAGAHPRRRNVRFLGVLGKLHRGAAMADREIALLERALGAFLQGGLELALIHILDEEIRARADLHAVPALAERLLRRGLTGRQDSRRDQQRRCNDQGGKRR